MLTQKLIRCAEATLPDLATAVIGCEATHDLVLQALDVTSRFSVSRRWLERAAVKASGRELSAGDIARLNTEIVGIRFRTPFMIAGGWNKAGTGLSALDALQFSGVEVGSVTKNAQPGNSCGRRIVPINRKVVINRLGTPSSGVSVVRAGLDRQRCEDLEDFVIGLNVAPNKGVSDNMVKDSYASVIRAFSDRKYIKYFALNFSNPNTGVGRYAQDRDLLSEIILEAVENSAGRPVFIKISPDLSEEGMAMVAEVALECKAAGLIASNSTSNPEIKAKYGRSWRSFRGGLSGADPDLRRMRLYAIRFLRREYRGLAIMGVGGIGSAADVWESLKAGATVTQVATALRTGLSIAAMIHRGLLERMDREGVRSISEIIGTGA